jgi:hypothetical protein
MAVPSTFADLSATPASNSGLISESSAVNVIDNHFQTIYAFMASVYANSGNGWASPYLPAANPSYTGTLTGGAGIVNLGSGQFYKDGSGNVGIGNTSPPHMLAVGNGSQANPRIRITGSSTAGIEFNDVNTSFVLGGANTMDAYTSGALRTRIDASGRLLVGRTAQNASAPLLSVEGRVDSVTTGSYASTFGSSSSAPFIVNDSTTTGEVERLRVDASGNLIPILQTSAPTLSTNSQMVFSLASNTSLLVSVRGSDGTTRTATITLA